MLSYLGMIIKWHSLLQIFDKLNSTIPDFSSETSFDRFSGWESRIEILMNNSEKWDRHSRWKSWGLIIDSRFSRENSQKDIVKIIFWITKLGFSRVVSILAMSKYDIGCSHFVIQRPNNEVQILHRS